MRRETWDERCLTSNPAELPALTKEVKPARAAADCSPESGRCHFKSRACRSARVVTGPGNPLKRANKVVFLANSRLKKMRYDKEKGSGRCLRTFWRGYSRVGVATTFSGIHHLPRGCRRSACSSGCRCAGGPASTVRAAPDPPSTHLGHESSSGRYQGTGWAATTCSTTWRSVVWGWGTSHPSEIASWPVETLACLGFRVGSRP